MVSKSNAYGVREGQFWCERATAMVLENNGYGIGK
jgi:hypothetical protein